MDEKLPPQENNKNSESEEFFKIYPLPEEHKDKIGLALELKRIFNSLIEKDSNKNGFQNFTIISNFAGNLKEKYRTDASRYYLYNVIIGSSGMKSTEFDFPGENSIEKFLKLQELSSKLDN